jgi:DNA-binding winged helix-turn-helix (wHTH) protein
VIYAFDAFELDGERVELRRSGDLVSGYSIAVRVLLALVQNAGEIVTKDELADRVWDGRPVADNVITVSMARLRQMLGQSRGQNEPVVTVYGRGYRFAGAVTTRTGAFELGSAVPASGIEAPPPFVGRDRALARLQQALAAASTRRGRLCALIGEPGIGKTRAVEALERAVAGTRVRFAWGYCHQAGDTPPLWPWLRLVREILNSDVAPDLERGLGPLASELQALLREPGALGGPQSRGVAGDEVVPRRRAFEALLRVLSLASERAPWVLVLDDLHRADAASIELLGLLLDELAQRPLLVLATLRAPGGRAPRPETQLPRVLGHRNCEVIALDRLGAEDVASYVGALVKDERGALGRAVYAKCEGNPFFMVELARQLRNAEQPDEETLAVSKTALELLAQRIAALAPETREVLAAAAAIGRSFELPLLAAVLGRPPSELIGCLDEALAADVVVAARDSGTAFEFGHELLRKVLYDALSLREQRQLHLRIGPALEQRAAAGEDVPAAELAYHFHAALPEGDLRRTVDHCRRAARAAGAVHANPDVVRYARRALEALDLMPQPSARLRGRLLYTCALYARGDGAEFPRAIAKVMRIAREHRDGPLLLSAAGMLNPHPGFTGLPGATAALEEALALLPATEAGGRGVALAVLSYSPPQCFEAERCELLLQEALASARASGFATPLRVALEAELYLHGGPAHEKAARATAAEIARLASEHRAQMPVAPVGLALHAAFTGLQRGEPLLAHPAIEEAITRAREVRHGELLWHSERFRVLSRLQTQPTPEDAEELAALHRRAEQRPILGTEAFCAFDRTVVLPQYAAEPQPIDEIARGALELDGSEPPSIWALKLHALSAAGQVGDARAALGVVAASRLARLPCDAGYLGTLGHLARAALLLPAPEYAAAVYTLLAPYAERFAGHVAFHCEGSVPQLRGMLACALGDHAAARALLEAGIAMDERAGLGPRAEEARLSLARCLLEHGSRRDRPRALSLAAQARAASEQLGLPGLARGAALLEADA